MPSNAYDILAPTKPGDSEPGLSACENGVTPDSLQCHFTYHDTTSTSPDIKPKNVILFGETGVGKSSIINLMAGRDVAETSSNLGGCTRKVTEHLFTLSDHMSLRVFDTAGLKGTETDATSCISDIENAQRLIASLQKTGNIDLLLFCIKAGRFTASMQRSYYLFSDILCHNRVPFALVVTHLEDEDVMENWWMRNERTLNRYGVDAVAHACVATLPSHITLHGEKRVQSRLALEKLFQDALSSRDPLSYMQTVRYRLLSLIRKPLLLLTGRSAVAEKLETYCALPRGEVQRLAKLIVNSTR